jgi:aminotransferase
MNRPPLSQKAERFTESVIREMTRLARLHGAVNLAQGMPDFPAPAEIKEAACRAIMEDVNQYAITWGAPRLRAAIAAKTGTRWKREIDPEREITVTCGSTEAMIASLLAVVDPGDEVVIFEPFYENYGPAPVLSGAVPRLVPLRPPDWSFDPGELERAFNSRTRAVILNTPNNPTGKVFGPRELGVIADLCIRWDAYAVTDEIYEHIVYDGLEHRSIATVEGMRDRTITINGMSKTYSVTGWRVGWAIAPPHLTRGIRKVHDFLTVGAPAPLQEAAVAALGLPPGYYSRLAAAYQERRDLLVGALGEAGFAAAPPQGAYYIMADYGRLSAESDTAFTRRLVEEAGVAVVPGSSFFHHPGRGGGIVRFCFCKREETLVEAKERLLRISSGSPKP